MALQKTAMMAETVKAPPRFHMKAEKAADMTTWSLGFREKLRVGSRVKLRV